MKKFLQSLIGWGITLLAAWIVTQDAVIALKILGCEVAFAAALGFAIGAFAQ